MSNTRAGPLAQMTRLALTYEPHFNLRSFWPSMLVFRYSILRPLPSDRSTRHPDPL